MNCTSLSLYTEESKHIVPDQAAPLAGWAVWSGTILFAHAIAIQMIWFLHSKSFCERILIWKYNITCKINKACYFIILKSNILFNIGNRDYGH